MRARNKPISSAPDRARCQETGISALDLAEGLRATRGEATTVQWASRLLARSSREGPRRRRVPHARRESPWGPVLTRGLGSTQEAGLGGGFFPVALGPVLCVVVKPSRGQVEEERGLRLQGRCSALFYLFSLAGNTACPCTAVLGQAVCTSAQPAASWPLGPCVR